MKNIWRDYWKGQTYNASALWGCFTTKNINFYAVTIYLQNMEK